MKYLPHGILEKTEDALGNSTHYSIDYFHKTPSGKLLIKKTKIDPAIRTVFTTPKLPSMTKGTRRVPKMLPRETAAKIIPEQVPAEFPETFTGRAAAVEITTPLKNDGAHNITAEYSEIRRGSPP